MKNILLLIVLLALTVNVIAQDYQKKIFNEKDVWVYPYSVSKYGIFPTLDSLPSGTWIAYALNNQKRINREWVEVDPFLDTNAVVCMFEVSGGRRNGIVEVYSAEGDVISKGQYKDDMQTGKWEYYFEGRLDGIAHFDKGILHGVFESYYKSGEIMERGEWEEGRPIGNWKRYHDNGVKSKEWTYVSCIDLDNKGSVINSTYKDEVIRTIGEYGGYSGYSRRNTFSSLPYWRSMDLGTCIDGDYITYSDKGEEVYRETYVMGQMQFLDTIVIPDTNFYEKGEISWYKETLIEDSLFVDHFFWQNGTKRGEVKYAQTKITDSLVLDRISKYSFLSDHYYQLDKYFQYAVRYDEKGRLSDSIVFNSTSTYKSNMKNISYHKDGHVYKYYQNDTLKNISKYQEWDKKHRMIIDLWGNYPKDSGEVVYYKKGIKYVSIQASRGQLFYDWTFFDEKGEPYNGKTTVKRSDFEMYTGDVENIEDEMFGQNSAKTHVKKWKGTLERGKFHGLWEGYNTTGDIICVFYFDRGVPVGSHQYYDFQRERKYRKNGSFRYGSETRYLKLDQSYENGVLDGWKNYYFSNGQISHKAKYVKGRAQAEIFGYYDDGIPKYEVSVKDSVFEYRALSYGYVSSITEFTDSSGLDYLAEKGKYYLPASYRNGKYFSYDVAGNIAYDGEYLNGEKVNKWTYWYETGIVKHTVLYPKDSILSGNYYNFSYSKKEGDGYHEYFYPNGNMSHKGWVVNMSRSGEWSFYNETGDRIKLINYGKGEHHHVNGQDTITVKHYGFYQSWYDNGQIQTEGYIIDESSKFDCNQETYLKMQGMFYLSHWEESGEQTLANGDGLLTTYHNTAVWASHGRIKNGLEFGTWRYWSPDGTLNMIGDYENGHKVGRWLEGDIEGAAYVDKACYRPEEFESDDEYEKHLKELSKTVRIKENYYYKGKKVNYLGHFMVFETESE